MSGNHEDCTGREKDCQDNKDQLSKRIEKLNGEITAATETKISLENQIDTLTSQSSDQVKGLGDQLVAKDNEVNQKNTRINELETSLKAEQDKNVALTSDLTSCNQKGAGLTDDIDALDKKLQECENKASGLKKNLDETTVNASNQVAELDSQINSLEGDLNAAKDALAKSQADHEGCNGREQACEENKTKLAGEVERLSGEIASVTETKESLESRIGSLTQDSTT